MALSGSLQLSYALGLCRNQGCYKQKVQRQDSWNIFLSDYLFRSISSVPYRTVSLSCSAAGKAIEPVAKAAALALTKSYSVLQRSPFVFKLVPAVAVLVFSLWGVVPLVRQGRNLLLNKNDNSWKKSSTYRVITSYIQPLLLWLGALYVCRALDPITLPTEASQIVKDRLLNFVRSLSTVLAFAYCLSSVIQQTQKFFMETGEPNDTRTMGFQFAGKAVYSAVWVAAVSLFMELLGFSTQKWLTAGGLGTVLITLAGREIFTNFLSSVMIHATRPFVLNEWIQTKIEGYEVSGTVEHVGWWSPTIIRGEDREAIHIPNHKFTVNVVRNLSQKTHWRIKTHLAISHLDVNKINNIVADMRKVLAKNPQVEQQRLHRRVFLDNVNPENQALLILISCFVKTSHFEEYLCVKDAVLLDLLRVISHHRARLATPIRTIRKMYTDSELENVPFGDSIYDHGGVASRRPLLIEPSYRINGEDKSKSQNRSSKPTGEQESKSSSSKSKETPALDQKVNGKAGETPGSGTKKVIDEVGAKAASKLVPNSNPPKDSETSEADKKRAKGSPSTKPPKNDGQQSETERADGLASLSRSALEENIVLGVALEGSKRTLPIEEEVDSSSSTAADAKELAGVRRSGNRPLTGDKEKKDGEVQAGSSASNEQ